ncbi:MAG: helix-turn-helix domain-containing protein [Pseudomonadota bacterium]|uniref:helix-turn-helix domain-containing protein n=1 Tax=Fodinicurvata TaxID=1121829 RepID=UPI00040A2517|nr:MULTISPECIES: helix-turn-helix domain-containing protein [Fodinicurvata]
MYHPTDVHIGRKIREKRVSLGMSQSALAEALGITFQQVQKYESGANRVGGSRLWDMSKALGVSVTYFFEGLSGPGNKAPMPKEPPLSRQSLELARAINAIPEGELKNQVVKLVKAFAKSA